MPHSVTSHIPELDGIRGIAILLVLIGHGWYHRFTLLAVSGVDLFFVLSGFLITRILIGSMSKPHYFSNFYIRRAFRIWPLYFVILCITYLTHIFSFSRQEFPAYRFVLYIQNFWSLAGTPSILAASWSLAIEEQFYLVWPVIVWLCSVPRRVGWISVILIVAMPASRVLYHLHGLDPYMLTFGRLDGLAAGAGLAVLTIGWSFDRDRQLKLIAVCLIVAILLLPLSHFALLRKAFKDTSMNLFWLVLLAVSFYWRGSSATRILRSAPLRFFGKISYCAYLVHMALLSGLDALPIVARLSIAVLVATASWYLFERPILQIKERFTRTGAITSKPNPVTSKIAIGV